MKTFNVITYHGDLICIIKANDIKQAIMQAEKILKIHKSQYIVFEPSN